jgi:opacity protein-like surface antigen
MKKKVYAKMGATMGAFLALALPGQTQANAINSGFYAGASVGLSSLSGKQDFHAQENVNPVVVLDNRSNGLSATSAGVSFFGGYGYKWNCAWLAAEVSYLFDRLNADRTAQFNGVPGDRTFQARSKGGAFGGSVHLGYIPQSNYAVYAILGLEMRRFEVGFLNSTNDNILPLAPKKYTSTAFVPGVGMLLKLTKNISLRGEYKYALHRQKTLTVTGIDPAPGGVNNVTSTLKQNPKVHTFQIGVVYSF